jgi:hypothetical protein
MSQENMEILREARIALPRLSESATQRRSMDQRLYVRFPPGTAGSPTPAYGCHHDLGCGG